MGRSGSRADRPSRARAGERALRWVATRRSPADGGGGSGSLQPGAPDDRLRIVETFSTSYDRAPGVRHGA
jgi:hypothetical protein